MPLLFAKPGGSPLVRLALALLLGVLSAVAFVELADEVLEGEATPVDRAIAQWIHRFDAAALLAAMRVVTWLGSGWVLVPVIVAIAAWALARRHRALAATLVLVGAAGQLLNVLLKLLFGRPRPDLVSIIMVPPSFAFPSGHAMLSTIVYGTAAFVAARLAPRLRRPLALATPLLVLLVGLSRVVLGVHWTTDVLAGWAAGGIVLAAALVGTRLWRSPEPDRAP